ncbi:pyruvate kinase [Metabacillus fastidiosus]|uniref:pyruvate kinase n=1 Tax=Metabacillus fastidiosus TaxID=1458 RepID=UPI003D29646E
MNQTLDEQKMSAGRELVNLYNQIRMKTEEMAVRFSLVKSEQSRNNLLAYLVLCKQNLQNINEKLIDLGVCPLKQIDGHVLYSLERILWNLDINPPSVTNLSIPTPSFARNTSNLRAANVLGRSRIEESPRIMVTLDANMIHKQDLIEELLLNGMRIARINCAHDEGDIWRSLIERVKKAEEKLEIPSNQACKIYMDLAGPKIRTGKIAEVKQPLKVVVPTDSYGREIYKVTGYLDCLSEHTMLTSDMFDSFILAIDNTEFLQQIKVNDQLTFTDTRKRNRKLTVIERISTTCVKVELARTAYIDETTVIHSEKAKCKVRSLLPKPQDIFVIRGDSLRLYLDSDWLGHAASKESPAGIPVTLEKAFRNVRLQDNVFIDDGKIRGIVKDITKQYIEIEIVSPMKFTKIKEEKGLNLPDSLLSLNVPALTEKDLKDLTFVAKHADIVGISFVHSPKDLIIVREKLEQYSAKHLAVVAKIETKDAVHQLSKIIMEGLKFDKFGIMIARGDLAIEVGPPNLSIVQEDILSICKAAHIPVIWATGVLEQLTKKGNPARSEITDTAQGMRADCIMLNKGPYINESVKMLTKILNANEPVRTQINFAPFIEQYGFSV